ncbi:transposase [Streptomyces sp. NC-S4]
MCCCAAGPGPERGGRWREHWQVIDAIAFKYRTGTPWMDLPEHFGSWKGAYNRFRKWAAEGTRARVFTALLAQADAEGDLERPSRSTPRSCERVSTPPGPVKAGVGRRQGGTGRGSGQASRPRISPAPSNFTRSRNRSAPPTRPANAVWRRPSGTSGSPSNTDEIRANGPPGGLLARWSLDRCELRSGRTAQQDALIQLAAPEQAGRANTKRIRQYQQFFDEGLRQAERRCGTAR